MNILEELRCCGGLLEGHFVFESGRHSSTYFNPYRVLPDVRLTQSICGDLGEPFYESEVETVAASAPDGIVLAQWTASYLEQAGGEVKAIWAEKVGRNLAFDHPEFQTYLKDRRVLVVAGTLSAKGPAQAVSDLAASYGGKVVGISAICSREQVPAQDLAVPQLHCLLDLQPSFKPSDCPLCEDKIPIVTNYGYGRRFKRELPNYPGDFTELLS